MPLIKESMEAILTSIDVTIEAIDGIVEKENPKTRRSTRFWKEKFKYNDEEDTAVSTDSLWQVKSGPALSLRSGDETSALVFLCKSARKEG